MRIILVDFFGFQKKIYFKQKSLVEFFFFWRQNYCLYIDLNCSIMINNYTKKEIYIRPKINVHFIYHFSEYNLFLVFGHLFISRNSQHTTKSIKYFLGLNILSNKTRDIK